MKKLKDLVFVSAIALLSVAGMTACSSSGDSAMDVPPVEPSPNYNPETNEVTAKFVFNVSTGNNMRQTSAATQASSTDAFRGIDNAVLLSAKQSADGKHITSAQVMDKHYDLSRIMTAGSIDAENSRRVIETSLPLNTNSLLFYGRAIEGTVATTNPLTAYDQFGHLEKFDIGGADGLTLSATNIELSSRINGHVDDFKKVEELLGGILTCIINTNMAGTNHVSITDASKYTYVVNASEYDDFTWADYCNSTGTSPVETGHELYPLEKKLADAFREMTVIKQSAGELRAGCGDAIIHTIQDLWSVINEVRCATPFSKGEAVAKYFAEKVHERIQQYFSGEVPSTGKAVTGVSYGTMANLTAHFAVDTAWPTEAGTRPADFSSISGFSNEELKGFPQRTYHLAAGSTHYLYDAVKKKFEYVQDYNTSAVGNTSFTVEDYCYPPELVYWGNSPIRVSNIEHKTDTYPASVSDWQKDAMWADDWVKNSHVTSATQSVAMQNNINYGTSLLKTTIAYGATTLKDNNHAIQVSKDPTLGDTDEPDNEIYVTNTSFQLVGLVIGGQSKKVGWNYLPQGNKSVYVYDCAINGAASIPTTGTSQPNYTLVFDNYNASPSDGKQDKVYVALELINNSGKDFFGEHNVIREGGTFYLIGELDPNKDGQAKPTWPTNHPLPPYTSAGTSDQVVRVFMQDYMTTANFVIGENSLKHAYLTVPDLRYSALTLGLSVDINWETGLVFNNVIVGGE